MTTPADGAALLERAVTYALGALALTDPTALHAPTPCRDWDLRALLGHLADSLTALSEAAETGHVPITAPPHPDDPVAAVRARARRLIGAWTAPEHTSVPISASTSVSIEDTPVTAGIVAAAGALEVAVHGWDVARACAAHHPLPEALAEELLDIAPLFVSDMDRPHRFALPVAVPAGTSAGDRLVAHCGRNPSGDPVSR